ncbi:MAG: hypothetical protein FWH52_02185 [Synergistaceae bacterium]|nr:hypothetical protein [Synergistaceae bacterium]
MTLHWDDPIFVNNAFIIVFDYKKEIRRCANQIEDILKKYMDSYSTDAGYNVPIITPIPDEMEPTTPRLIFNSLHGFSQIIFNQKEAILNVRYSDDYLTVDAMEQRKNYLSERIRVLHNILEEIKCKALFSGVVTRILILTPDEEEKLRVFLQSFIVEKYRIDSTYEYTFREAGVLEGKFFNIFQIGLYREMLDGENPFVVPRIPASNSIKRGIEIIHDINDRHSYNENANYFTTLEASENMLDRTEHIIQQFFNRFRKD